MLILRAYCKLLALSLHCFELQVIKLIFKQDYFVITAITLILLKCNYVCQYFCDIYINAYTGIVDLQNTNIVLLCTNML